MGQFCQEGTPCFFETTVAVGKYQQDVNVLNKEGRKNLLRWKTEKGVSDDTLEEKWQKYNDKFKENSEERLKKQNTHFILLSLAEHIYEFEGDNNKFSEWKKVGYNEYAQKLSTCAPKTLTEDNQKFKCDVIVNYAEYVNNFCKYLTTELPTEGTYNKWKKNKWTKTLASNKALREIRMDDIWQKLIANHILIELCKKGEKVLVTDSKKYCISTKDEEFVEDAKYIEFVKVAANFSRGTALINIIIHIGDGCVFGVQIQNGLYKRFLGTTTKQLTELGVLDIDQKIGYYCNKLERLPDMFRYKHKGTSDWKFPTNNNGKQIFDKGISPDKEHQNKGLKHDKEDSLHGFGGYGAPFLAQWKKISATATIENVLDAMINDCLKVRELLKESRKTANKG